MHELPEHPLPAFFLAEPPGHGPPLLAPGESEHALRVLRLKPGDHCVGLDGEGHRWTLRIVAASKSHLGLEALGPPAFVPPPGEEGAALPWIELAVAWPRKQRAEAMIGPLIQLGAAAITPLAAEHGGAGNAPDSPPERWWKLAREAMKQCGRSWLPVFGDRRTPAELVEERPGACLALLDPVQGMSFDVWLRSLTPAPLGGIGTRERPIVLFVGPEGGFDEGERELLRAAHATGVLLGPHILRIETAAEAAMAVASTVLALPWREEPRRG